MAYLRIPWVLTRAHPEICYVPSDAEAAYRLNPVHPRNHNDSAQSFHDSA